MSTCRHKLPGYEWMECKFCPPKPEEIMTDTDKPDAGEKRLKKVLSDHHKAQMRGKMGGAAMCVCGQGCGTTAACGEYHELLNQSAQLSALRTKLAEVEAELAVREQISGKQDELLTAWGRHGMEMAEILGCLPTGREVVAKVKSLQSDLASLRSLLSGATEIRGEGWAIHIQAGAGYLAEVKRGDESKIERFETIEQAFAWIDSQEGKGGSL